MGTSVFADLASKAWPHRFTATLDLANIVGGTPSDPKVAEGWLKSKIQTTDSRIQQMVGEAMAARALAGTDKTAAELAEEAVAEIQASNVNGFKRDDSGLYIEGRHVKAMVKEAASVALAGGFLRKGQWGATNKGLLGFIAEHVMVVEDRIPLLHQSDDSRVTEATGILQRFVSTFRGQGISYDEYVENARVHFTIICDYDFSREEWGHIFLKAEQQGLGACRSQGYGRFVTAEFEEVKQSGRRKLAAAAG